jgi:FkbM family methyltransferase
MIDLYVLARAMGVRARHVVEVGVNEPERCSVARFLGDGARGTLVEPLPWCVENLRRAFPAARVIEAVCGERSGTMLLYDRGEGAWTEEVPKGGSPDEAGHGVTRESFGAEYVRRVRCVRFAEEIDSEDIDVLAVDVEGAEWQVIGQMTKARPKIVRVETHCLMTGYVNPYAAEIRQRMRHLGYYRVIEDVSDTLWVRV